MIQGFCHCGAVQWQFESQPEGATACNCTVCRRYAVLWAYDYDGAGVKVSGATGCGDDTHRPLRRIGPFEDLPRDGRCVAEYWF